MKKIGTCPACSRDIESGDDVVEVNHVVYHEGCEPATPQAKPEPPAEPVEPKGEKVEKQPKMTQAQMIERLTGLVASLASEVAELKNNRAAAPAARASKPKSEKGAPRPHVYYVIKGFPSEKRPPQCLRIFRAIAQAAPADGRMTEMDVWNALMAEPFPSTKPNPKIGAWHHVQTPFYIFKYYRADMINAEYVAGPFDVV